MPVEHRLKAVCEGDDCDTTEEYWGTLDGGLASIFGGQAKPTLPDGWAEIQHWKLKDGKKESIEKIVVSCPGCVEKAKQDPAFQEEPP